ncbi:O-antigen ligase family protein [Mesobacillus zeae]|uniref:O-antigen ligase domain-containing protein n=1 Tax=Mesobacillus zeae TaxID=1917180 RepID=A0A398AYB4_9BACI|nr:O-antigen ligase family protein [Mesobacillus zeae]RID82659.1 O-antigen ligase domain-containing protein [Mesobacillus zeae]
MANTKISVSLIRLFSFAFFTLLVFNVFGKTILQPYKDLALVTIDVTLYLSFFLLIYAVIKDKGYVIGYFNIYIGFILLSGIYLASHIYHGNFEQNEQLLFLFLIFVFILAVMKIKWTPSHLIIFGHLANIIILYFFFQWIGNGYIAYMYKGVFGNPNVFANFLFAILYFQVINIQKKTLGLKLYFMVGIIINLLLIFMSTSRTVWLSLAVIVGSFLVMKFSRKLFSKLFYFVLGGNFLFLITYVYLARTQYADTINDLTMKLTSKPFFSGREEFWGDVIDFGLTSPLIGHKVGIQLNEYMPGIKNVHVHNQYLQVFVESGFLGLFAFLLLLYFIWKAYQVNLDSHYVQWSACFLLGLLIYQNFEISMFSNMLSIGLIQWLGISIGVSMAIHKDDGIGSYMRD